MSDEHYVLSPAPFQPPPPTEADYEAIFAAVMETVRGRWFLSEFGRRNRHADTQSVLGAIERLEAMVRGERTDPAFERIRSDIRDMADAIAATRREISAIRHDDDHKGIGEATEELDAIVVATERATSDILAAAETIQETAWTLREQGLDGPSCDKLDRCATDVYLACSFQDLTGQRTRKVINVLRFLEGRINAMVEILGDDGRDKDEPARAHAPLDSDMDQAEIDAVIPTTHATRAQPMAGPAHRPDAFDHQPGVLPEVSPISTVMDAGEPAYGSVPEASLNHVDMFSEARTEAPAKEASAEPAPQADPSAIAPGTRTLMADLLAIIRPDGESQTAANAAPGADSEATVEPAPQREDFRLMRPLAPGALSSDFVIVPLAIDADDAVAAAPVTVTDTAAAVVADPAVEAFAPPATDESVAVAADGAAVVSEPTGDADALPPIELAAGDAFTAQVEVLPSADIDIADLDNDLLSAAEALAPPRAPVVDIAAEATAIDDPMAAASATDEIAGFVTEMPADLAASPATDVEATEAAAIVDDANVDEVIVENVIIDEVIVDEPIADEPSVDDILPMPSPVLSVVAAANDDAAPVDDDADAPAHPLAAEGHTFDEPALPSVWSQPQLTVNATAALTVLAMSASPTMTAETSVDVGHDEVAGHADPLAAVTALSVEERIALFS